MAQTNNTGYQNTADAGHPLRWWLHVLVIMYYTMGFIARFAWPPLKGVAAADLGVTEAAAAAYMSAFYIGYVLIHIPAGMLGDRFGARLVIGVALLVEAIGTFGVAIAPDYSIGFAFRILTGIGAGAVYSSCVRYVSSLFPAMEKGLAFGLMMAAPGGIGVLLPNLLMPRLEIFMGWRGAFEVVAIIILVFAAVAFLIVRDKPSPPKDGKIMDGVFAVLKNRNLVLLGCTGFWLMLVMVSFVTMSNSYIESLGFSRQDAGNVMLVYGITGMIGSPLGGILAAKAKSPKLAFAAIFLCMAPFYWLFGQSTSLAALSAIAGIIGFILGMANPFTPILTAMFAGKKLMATAGGVTGCVFQIGGILGPWLLGLSLDVTKTYTVAWLILAVAPFAGILCLMPMGKGDLNGD